MSSKDKYDRQLRLWGPEGQRRLANSHVLLIQASSCGTELLKNLVLPGIGKFTILDDDIITHDDLSSNFFLRLEDVGKPKAKVVSELLKEMNNDVEGYFLLDNYKRILKEDPSYFASFSLIVSSLKDILNEELASLCWEHKIPFISLRSEGYLGYVSIQIRDHWVLEVNDEALISRSDLRINQRFPLLQNYIDSFKLEELDSMEHSHTPYVVILAKAIDQWEEKFGSVPKTMKEKDEFKSFIKSLSRCYEKEENFQEAVQNQHLAYTSNIIRDEIKQLLNDQLASTTPLPKTSANFYFLLRALAHYYNKFNSFPVSDSIPDLTSNTHFYCGLKETYAAEFRKNKDDFRDILDYHLQLSDLPPTHIQDDEICYFLRQTNYISHITTTQMNDRLSFNLNIEDLNEIITCDLFEVPDQTPILWYFALRAADIQSIKRGSIVGDHDDDNLYKEEVEAVHEEMKNVWNKLSLPLEYFSDSMKEDLPEDSCAVYTKSHSREVCRSGGVEVVTISSIIGAIGSQEAIKILTHLYIPLDNTYVYNGISGVGGTYIL